MIDRYRTPFRLDRNVLGGAVMLYVGKVILSKAIAVKNCTKPFFIEINLLKKKWLFYGLYNSDLNLKS